MSTTQLPDLQALVNHSASEVWEWFQFVGKRIPYSDTNWWIGLAYVANQNAFLRGAAPLEMPDMEWAKIAIGVNEYINKANAHGCHSCIEMAMRIRCKLINAFGEDSDNDLLSIKVLSSWFLENAKLDFEIVARDMQFPLKDLFEMDKDYVYKLRRIKARLNVLQELQHAANLDQSIAMWFTIKDKLP